MTIWQVGRFEDDPKAEFAAYARSVIEGLGADEKHAIVFVHGFNVPFEGALYRSAQLKFDLDFAGPVFTFSWPSDGDPLRYMADQDDADISVGALARYLRLVDAAVGPETRVHVIAHSMGSRVTAQALARLKWEAAIHAVPKPFENVVLAGGDIDRIYFAELLRAAQDVPRHVTVYTSDSDKALYCSRLVRGLFASSSDADDPKARIGLHGDELGRATSDAYDTIDISEFGSTFGLRCTNEDHADYAQEPEVFYDLSCLLAGDEPGSARRSRSLAGPEIDEYSTGDYWLLEKGRIDRGQVCEITRTGLGR